MENIRFKKDGDAKMNESTTIDTKFSANEFVALISRYGMRKESR